MAWARDQEREKHAPFARHAKECDTRQQYPPHTNDNCIAFECSDPQGKADPSSRKALCRDDNVKGEDECERETAIEAESPALDGDIPFAAGVGVLSRTLSSRTRPRLLRTV
jgi:hypothetical protein